MLRQIPPLLARVQRDMRRRPAKDPLRVFDRDIHTAMRAALAKSAVPESAVNGYPALNVRTPGNRRRGVAAGLIPSGHVF